jgi:hypothetical protein
MMETPESCYGMDAVLWCLEEADDQLAVVGGELSGIALCNSAAALGMTLEQFATSEDDTGQAGDHDPCDRLADALYNELCGHISHAQDCARALAAFVAAAETAAGEKGKHRPKDNTTP